MRILSRLLALIPAYVTALCGQAPLPCAGSKLVSGGENLVVNGYWDTAADGNAPVSVKVSNGVLLANT